MRLEARKYLYDAQKAVERIVRFTRDKSFEDYTKDDLLRAAVERQFEIVGEALGRLARIEPVHAAKISEYQRIIAFRNILIHGYADIDGRVVWGVLESKLPTLLRELAGLIEQQEG